MDFSTLLIGLESLSTNSVAASLNAIPSATRVFKTNSIFEATGYLSSQQIHLVFVNIDHQGDSGPSLFDMVDPETCKDTGYILLSSSGPRLLNPLITLYRQLGFRIIGQLQVPFGFEQVLPLIGRYNQRVVKETAIEIPEGDLSDSIDIRFLPRFNTRKQIVGCDILSRLVKDGEVIPADVFIPKIENSNSMSRFTKAVINNALNALAEHKESFGNLDFSIIVPKSVLSDPDIVGELVYLCEKNEIDMSKLSLTLKEDNALLDGEETKVKANNIVWLVRSGIRFVVDNQSISLPTGLSNWHPVDRIKLAPSVATDIAKSPFSQAMMQGSMVVAKSGELEVVVTGIETKEIYKELTKNYIDKSCKSIQLQGFYFSGALTADEFLSQLYSMASTR